jgi:DNA repair protein RadC
MDNYNFERVEVRLVREKIDEPIGLITGPIDAVRVLRKDFEGLDREAVFVIGMNNARAVMKSMISLGSLTEASAGIPETLRVLLNNPVNSFIVMHNHISGNIRPSSEDLTVMKYLSLAGHIVGLVLEDFIIIDSSDPERFFSAMDEDLLYSKEYNKSKSNEIFNKIYSEIKQ